MMTKDNRSAQGPRGTGSCGICGTPRNRAPMGGAYTRRGGACGCDQRAASWMRRLQVIDFSLQELVLYLDMYPECRRALEKFHALCAERREVLHALRERGISICATDNEGRESWDWINGPWPWEFDFVGNRED